MTDRRFELIPAPGMQVKGFTLTLARNESVVMRGVTRIRRGEFVNENGSYALVETFWSEDREDVPSERNLLRFNNVYRMRDTGIYVVYMKKDPKHTHHRLVIDAPRDIKIDRLGRLSE